MRHVLTEHEAAAPKAGRSLRVVRLSDTGLVVGHTDDGRACLLGVIERPGPDAGDTAARPQGSELLELLPLLAERAPR